MRWSNRHSIIDAPVIVLDVEHEPLKKCVTEFSDRDSIVVMINFFDDGTNIAKCKYDPLEQNDIVSDAIAHLFAECKAHLSVLARARFEIRGFVALEEDFNLFEAPALLNWSDPTTLELFFSRLSRAWIYRGKHILASDIARWVDQFETKGFGAEAKELLLYLHQHGFITENAVVEGLLGKYEEVKGKLGYAPTAISIQSIGKSEQKIAYRLRPSVRLVSLSEALGARRIDDGRQLDLICFDDCIGSGESVEKYLFDRRFNPLRDQLVDEFKFGRVRLYIAAYNADSRGIERIVNNIFSHGAISVLPVRLLDASHQVFSQTSRVLKDEERRRKFEQFCRDVGEQLFPGSPLGWENGQWCITYDYTIPDNSLPILYQRLEGDSWIPLFERNR